MECCRKSNILSSPHAMFLPENVMSSDMILPNICKKPGVIFYHLVAKVTT